jgi:shikimate dehydrogenase
MAVRPEDFAYVVRGLAKAGFAGANVTIPHKEAAFAVCDKVAPAALRAGAVNTLVFKDGVIEGTNTDGAGFVANLRAHGAVLGGPALLLGGGGAARAIAVALQDAGVAVTICNRTSARAAELAEVLGAETLPWAEREAELRRFLLLVNTTSLGMVNHPPLEMALDAAADGLVVADIVYAPLETKLLADAKVRGLKAVEGLGMLLHQAVPGFFAWFGVMPVVDEEIYRIVSAP